MAIDGTRLSSRRALLTGAAGGLAAVVAATLGRPLPVQAGSGPVTLGGPNLANSLTTITNTANSAFKGIGTGGGIGVEGDSTSGPGVYGFSDSGQGVWGEGTDLGVYGHSGYGVAVEAFSQTGTGVYAHSNSGIPIEATNQSADLSAVVGLSTGRNTGVQGFSGNGNIPVTPRDTGVFGSAATGAAAVGIHGESTSGRGGLFKGKLASIRLIPTTSTGHPSSGARGDLVVDKSGHLWFCKGGTTWKQIV